MNLLLFKWCNHSIVKSWLICKKGPTQRREGIRHNHWFQGRKEGRDSPKISPIMKIRQMTEAKHNLFLATFFSRSRSSRAWLLSWQCLMATVVPSRCVSMWWGTLQRTYEDWLDSSVISDKDATKPHHVVLYDEIMVSKSSKSLKSLTFILVISLQELPHVE